jgi:hypothetical protein
MSASSSRFFVVPVDERQRRRDALEMPSVVGYQNTTQGERVRGNQDSERT